MEIDRICNNEVITATKDTSVFECAQLMREHHIGDVIITEETSEGRTPKGILTDRDIVVSLVAEGATDLRETPAKEAMTETIIVAKQKDDVYEVLQNMEVNGIRRVPIVDDDNSVTGILSFDDLVGFFSDEFSRLADLLNREIETETERDRG